MPSAFQNAVSRIGTALCCWRTYHRVLRELSAASDQVLAELGTRRSDIYGFAWQCACHETAPTIQPLEGVLREMWFRTVK